MSSPDPQNNSENSAKSKRFQQYLAAFTATLGSVSLGTYLAWSSSALPLYGRYGTMRLTVDEGSWIASLLPLGALVGAFPAGWLADKLGRKYAILATGLLVFLCWFPIGFAPKPSWILWARFLAGASAGSMSVIIPMYVSEIAEPAIRGTLGSLFQLQITIGVLLEYFAGLLGDLTYIALISATIPAALLISFFFMPESPVWLMTQDRRADAFKSMQRLRGENFPIDQELSQLENNRKSQSNDSARFSDLKYHRKAVIISLGLMIFQQLSGINAVVFYAGEIFSSGRSLLNPALCSIILGVAQVIATSVSTVLVDRAGRKVLLLASSSVMAACLFILTVYYQLTIEVTTARIPWVPLITLTIYIVMFSIGFGPIPWLMVAEISPTSVIGIISSMAAMMNWMLAFTVTKIFANMLSFLGPALSFGVFTTMCILGTIFVAIYVPETKGKTSEEIQMTLHELRGKVTETESASKA